MENREDVQYSKRISHGTTIEYRPNATQRAGAFYLFDDEGDGFGCSEEAVQAMITLLKKHRQPNVVKFKLEEVSDA